WAAIKNAFKTLAFSGKETVAVFGIGCSGNMNDFLWTNSIHSLHGRAIPNAVGVKIANHKLSVVVIAGDGDCYGEGGNHLIHAARGNHDITVIVHDNRVYGLTTGQVAPTALQGSKSKSTPAGIIEVPLNPIALALTQGATFIAQGFAGDVVHLSDIIAKGIKHNGFSLINIFQPCVSFNKITTYSWYREHIYRLDENSYDASDYKEALEKSSEFQEKIPIGVIYQTERPSYTDNLVQLKERPLNEADLKTDIEEYLTEFE
ncbi:2-oxoacid ferredoxin oxidoreductase, partial [Candidatus Gottesmanbacteria bacterium RBG_13_37_7]